MGRHIVVFILVVLSIYACRTRYISVPIETTKTEYKTIYQSDTIRITDSVMLTQRADTIFVEKRTRAEHLKLRIDTLVRVDTIPIVQEIPIETDTYRWKRRLEGGSVGLLTATLFWLFFFLRGRKQVR